MVRTVQGRVPSLRSAKFFPGNMPANPASTVVAITITVTVVIDIVCTTGAGSARHSRR
jgi:hypothetical protein